MMTALRAGHAACLSQPPLSRGDDMDKAFISQASKVSRWFVIVVIAALLAPVSAIAADRAALERDARNVYQKLTAKVPAAKVLSRDAVAVLVFPKITKAGLVVGGQYGDGVLLKDGKAAGYYNTAGASYGLQAGAQQYSYAMFFMNEHSLKALNEADGFEIGVGPSVVVVDQGMGKSLTSTTAQDDIYAFIFGQTGLMAGIGLQGNKITRLNE
ncbi:MAG TPA: lipid-binding SYLF domain-containing protein [Accumulibacter sp.]|uniref:lipid-binding SYLF domain-containing protein n=1 Tax=Accumulibacter sp. TaxID=2053492 RepID=UPI002C17472F|nr:lipid-binding SYLF domain-containing protein [Accumulibacter sp.]HRF72048.1 lipid-binding SYLF domain-containing protein [Accumulibacter sp.]